MVRPLVRSSLFFAAVAGMAACAAPPPPLDASGAPRACFSVNRTHSFSDGEPGDGRVLVRASAREVFEVETTGVCPDIDWARSLAIEADGGGTRLCEGDRAILRVPSAVTRSVDRCLARVIRRVPAEERPG